MVGEHAVRLQKLASGGICAKRLKHLPDKESARPVARVDYDMQPRQRTVVIVGFDAKADFFTQALRIQADQVDL